MSWIKKIAGYGATTAAAFAVAMALLFAGPASSAQAALTGVTPSATLTAANGAATVTYTAAGVTAGDIIQFATTRGTWSNGQTVITAVASGTTATAKLSSSSAGTVTVVATNLSAGGSATDGTGAFYGAPSAAVGSTGALTLPTPGALGAASKATTVSGELLTLVTGFTDATAASAGGPLALVGFPVTVTTTIGTFAQSGLGSFAGLTGAGGQLPTLNLNVSTTAASSGTITATITTVMGDLTVTGLLHVVGPSASVTLARTTPSSGSIAVASTQTITATVLDAAGNPKAGVTPVGSVTTAGQGTLTVVFPATNAAGKSTATFTGATGKTGDATVKATVGTLSGEVTFAIAGASAVLTITGPDVIAPGAAGQFTATVVDANGNPVVIGADGVTFSVTGAALGNLMVQVAPVATNAAGEAAAFFVSGGVAGTYTVTAISTSGLANFFVFTVGTVAPTPTPGAGFAGGSAPASGAGAFLSADGAQTLGDLVTALGDAGCSVLSLAVPAGTAFDFLFPAVPLISDLATTDTIVDGGVFFASCS